MNKQELITKLSKKTGLTKTDSEKTLNAFVESVSEELQKKNRVKLLGFGTFSTKERAARTCINPQNGQEIKVPAKTVTVFKPGKKLAGLVK